MGKGMRDEILRFVREGFREFREGLRALQYFKRVVQNTAAETLFRNLEQLSEPLNWDSLATVGEHEGDT
jgi:hypothetical protein